MSNCNPPHDQQAQLDEARAELRTKLDRKPVAVEDALREAAIVLVAAGRATSGSGIDRESAALAALRQAIRDERDAAVAPIAQLHNDARAEIARLTAELAAAREVADARREWLGTGDAAKSPPRTDTAAIAADMLACAESWAPGAMLMGNVRADEIAAVCRELANARAELAAARAVPADVETAIDAYAVAVNEIGDTSSARRGIHSAVAFAIDEAVADFIDIHAKRLAGDDWNLMDADDQSTVAGRIHDVLNHLRADEERFELSNGGANIRRIEKRIAELRAKAAAPTRDPITGNGYAIVEDRDANRVQIRFDFRPPAATIAVLKSRGFRWAPSENAWQRQASNGAWHAAQSVAASLDAGEIVP